MSAINVGAVSVDVLPDMRRFTAEIDAEVRKISDITIDVGANITAARAAIDELARTHTLDIDTRLNDGAVRAELDELTRNRTVDVDVRQHTSGDSGGGGIGLAGGLALASPLAIPLGAAAIGGIAGIGAGAVAAAAGAGALALGLSGVKNAITAVQTANQQSGAAAAASAIAQANAAAAVKSAQAGLSNAIANAAYSQTTAEQNLMAAQQAATLAQQSLTLARAQAKQQMEDLTLAVEDGALAQRQANLNVIAAQQALQKTLTNPASTQLQREQAQLTYDQAVQQVKDIGVRQARLQQQQAKSVKAGVEGQASVVAAHRNVVKALQGVDNAQRAQANSARQGAASIAAAQLTFQNAQRAAAVAANNTSSASKAAATALAGLSPAGRDFAHFVINDLEPAFKRLKASASAGLLPGLEFGLKALLPIMPTFSGIVSVAAKAVGDLFAQFGKAMQSPFMKQFLDDLKGFLGPAIKTAGSIIGNLATGFAGLFDALMPLGKGTGDGLAKMTKSFADWATHLKDNKGFQDFLAYIRDEGPKVVKLFGELAKIVGTLIPALAPLGGALLPIIEAIAKFLAQLSPGELITVVAGATASLSLLFLAFDVTPVGLIVTAIAAFAAGLVYAWQHSETFRDIVTSVFKIVAGNIITVVKGILWYVDQWAKVSDAIFGTNFHKSIQGAINEVNRINNVIQHLGDKTINIKIATTESFTTGASVGETAPLAARGHSGTVAGPYLHRALGGDIFAGQTYWVGEHGPELFHATQNGYITSHADSLAMTLAARTPAAIAPLGGDGSGGLHIDTINITNPAPEPASTSAATNLRRLQFTLGS